MLLSMGFGFNLIGSPLLILATIGLLIAFFLTKQRVVLIILGSLWGLMILLFLFVSVFATFHKPQRLTKDQIIGDYYIDKGFYPGANANWQYDHYRFTITPTDSIYLFVRTNTNLEKVYKGKLDLVEGPPVLWHAQENYHHILRHPPTLYRSYNRYYYVLHSEIFGNMFFRKKSE